MPCASQAKNKQGHWPLDVSLKLREALHMPHRPWVPQWAAEDELRVAMLQTLMAADYQARLLWVARL
jgi:hypothetical protein